MKKWTPSEILSDPKDTVLKEEMRYWVIVRESEKTNQITIKVR